jgi:hypothetical protein
MAVNMTKINFEDAPSTATPIDADNLNQVQTNVENAIKTVDKRVDSKGWHEVQVDPTLTYLSWDNTVKTSVINSDKNLTNILSVGMKVRFKQGTNIKYGIITKITTSQITLFMGTDYILENSAITEFYYSMLKAPYDFPMDKNKWTIEVKIEEILTQNNPINGGWYNIGNLNIQVPVGCWKLSYSSTALALRQGTNIVDNWVIMTLSKTTNNETERDMTVALYNAIPSTNSVTVFDFVFLEKEINIETTTTYYLLMSTLRDGNSYLRMFGNSTPTIIRAICSYL